MKQFKTLFFHKKRCMDRMETHYASLFLIFFIIILSTSLVSAFDFQVNLVPVFSGQPNPIGSSSSSSSGNITNIFYQNITNVNQTLNITNNITNEITNNNFITNNITNNLTTIYNITNNITTINNYSSNVTGIGNATQLAYWSSDSELNYIPDFYSTSTGIVFNNSKTFIAQKIGLGGNKFLTTISGEGLDLGYGSFYGRLTLENPVLSNGNNVTFSNPSAVSQGFWGWKFLNKVYLDNGASSIGSIQANTFCNATNICKDLVDWAVAFNSTYDTTTKEWNGNKSMVYNYSTIDQAFVTSKNYLTTEQDLIAISAMNANISAWTNTFNSTYASYSFGARNETIDTFNLYNTIWVTTFNATYASYSFGSYNSSPIDQAYTISYVNTNLSNYYTKSQVDTNVSLYVKNIASGVTQLAATAVTKNNCSQPIKTTATGTLNSSVIAWSFNSSSLSTVAQKVAWGSLTLDVFPTDNAVNFMICNPTNVSVTSTLAGTNWRVI